jgi:hypothetical protein
MIKLKTFIIQETRRLLINNIMIKVFSGPLCFSDPKFEKISGKKTKKQLRHR